MIEVSVLHGLKQGNDVLKQIHKEMSIESVEKLMEETAEAREYQQEIGEILSNRLTLDEEDAVQAELAELQADALGEREAPQPSAELPSPPTMLPLDGPEEDKVPSRPRERVRIPA